MNRKVLLNSENVSEFVEKRSIKVFVQRCDSLQDWLVNKNTKNEFAPL